MNPAARVHAMKEELKALVTGQRSACDRQTFERVHELFCAAVEALAGIEVYLTAAQEPPRKRSRGPR